MCQRERPHFRVSGTIYEGDQDDDLQWCSCRLSNVSRSHEKFAKSVTVFCRGWQHAEVLFSFYICWKQARDEELASSIASMSNVLHFWCRVSRCLGNHWFPNIWSYHCCHWGWNHHGLEIFQVRRSRLPFCISDRESQFPTFVMLFIVSSSLGPPSWCTSAVQCPGWPKLQEIRSHQPFAGIPLFHKYPPHFQATRIAGEGNPQEICWFGSNLEGSTEWITQLDDET